MQTSKSCLCFGVKLSRAAMPNSSTNNQCNVSLFHSPFNRSMCPFMVVSSRPVCARILSKRSSFSFTSFCRLVNSSSMRSILLSFRSKLLAALESRFFSNCCIASKTLDCLDRSSFNNRFLVFPRGPRPRKDFDYAPPLYLHANHTATVFHSSCLKLGTGHADVDPTYLENTWPADDPHAKEIIQN